MTEKPALKQKLRCAIYTRKSTEEGLDQNFNSLDAQRESAEAYVASQKEEGWVCIPDHYDDGGFTGGNMDRPAFQRLMADIAEGRIDCVMVYKVDRLSRSLLDFGRIMETLDKNGVSLVSVTQQFNTTTSMGRLTLNILLSFAQFEREIISERTRDKMGAARRKGKWTGGPPVLGYDRLRENGNSRLIVNEAEAEQVRAIYKLYLKEESVLATIHALRARGWKRKRYQSVKGHWRGGADFDKSGIYKILTNILYTGKVSYKGDIYKGEHAAIIDEDLFGRVQGLLRHNRNSGGKYIRNKHGALLKGLVRCKHCGCAMSHHFATHGAKRYRYYVCVKAQKNGWSACPSPSLPAGELERFVVEQIKGLGKDSELLEESIQATQVRLQDEIGGMEKERKAVEDRLRSLSREVGTLASQAGFNSEATGRMERCQARMREEEQEITRINERIARARRRMLEPDELAGAVEAFETLWQSLPPAQQVRLIHLLVDRIEYDGANESISMTFHPTGIRTLTEQYEEATA